MPKIETWNYLKNNIQKWNKNSLNCIINYIFVTIKNLNFLLYRASENQMQKMNLGE